MMKIERVVWAVLTAGAVAMSAACAQVPMPYQAPVSATPPSGRVTVSQAVNLLDASGSQEGVFSSGRATLESIVGVMPNGSYSAGNIVFGGYDREATGQSAFNRGVLASSAKNASFLQGATPIFDVIENDLQASIGGTSGRAAVVLISDGLATDFRGRAGSDQQTLDAARALAASRSGETCFHTVQVGSDAGGAALLQSLANVSSCGSARNASSLGTASALQQFSREVYLGGAAAPAPRPAPAPTATPDRDSDGDGVMDSADACPNTLTGARVDSRGCWTLRGLRFAVNSANLEGEFAKTLAEDLAVLKANPKVRVRVDGHTDSDGSEAYNQSLSLRRAETVRDYFVKQGGLAASRFEVKGYGESAPAVPNDSSANKRINRRVELTIID